MIFTKKHEKRSNPAWNTDTPKMHMKVSPKDNGIIA